jgi:hypothetical protein
MSTALAIASVTHVLKDLLNDGIINNDVPGMVGGNVVVSALPPDRIETGTTSGASQLNLYMYQATPNPGWRNQGLPSHNSGGARISNPPLALDLHYLLTAYGAEELHHEILLGYGMQLLHETPVLVREAIRRSLGPPTALNASGLPAHLSALSSSELADQIEQIKISPEIMNTEEISRLWTAFGAKYRPNAAYKVTVVIIESRKSTQSALPVRERNIYVIPFRQPAIEKISSRAAPAAPIVENQKILPGYILVLSGRELQGDLVSVHIDGIEITSVAIELSDTQISFPLPADLQAGIHGVQVVHQILMGSPPLPHQGVSSNVQAFVLSPNLAAFQATNVVVDGNGLRSALIVLTVIPLIRETQQVVLLLNELTAVAGAVPLAYSFQVPTRTLLSPPGPAEEIVIPVTGVAAGTYLLRIQVDGAESPLLLDAAFRYHAPQITIP